jgi:DNA-directed RNA polymerase subunit H (RpoH/RPB5)
MSDDYNNANFQKLYKSRNNLIDMFDKQNYNVDDVTGTSVNELFSMIKNSQLDMLLEHKENNKKTYIKFFGFYDDKKSKILNKNVIDNMIEDLFEIEEMLNTNDSLMIVNNSDANDTIKSHIKHIWEDQKIHIIIININNLQFNILNHSFVPPHSILNSKEEQEFRKQYNINNNNSIPEISRFDPVAQIICLKPTEICKILRPSKNAVEANYFRICKNK